MPGRLHIRARGIGPARLVTEKNVIRDVAEIDDTFKGVRGGLQSFGCVHRHRALTTYTLAFNIQGGTGFRMNKSRKCDRVSELNYFSF